MTLDEPQRAAEGGYPPDTCRLIYTHGDKQRVCARQMGHDGGHSPRDRDRFPDIDEQVARLQREYDDWEAGVKQDLGEVEGEAALDAGAWVDGARDVVQFAGPEISPEARSEFLRTHGLSPHRLWPEGEV